MLKIEDLRTVDELYFKDGANAIVLLSTLNGDIFAGSTWGYLRDIKGESILNELTERENNLIKVLRPIDNIEYTKCRDNGEVVWETESKNEWRIGCNKNP